MHKRCCTYILLALAMTDNPFISVKENLITRLEDHFSLTLGCTEVIESIICYNVPTAVRKLITFTNNFRLIVLLWRIYKACTKSVLLVLSVGSVNILLDSKLRWLECCRFKSSQWPQDSHQFWTRSIIIIISLKYKKRNSFSEKLT